MADNAEEAEFWERLGQDLEEIELILVDDKGKPINSLQIKVGVLREGLKQLGISWDRFLQMKQESEEKIAQNQLVNVDVDMAEEERCPPDIDCPVCMTGSFAEEAEFQEKLGTDWEDDNG